MTRLRAGRRGRVGLSRLITVLLLLSGPLQANDGPLHQVEIRSDVPQLLPIATKGVNPFDPVGLNNKAVEQMARGDYRAALVLLDRAAHLAPHHPEIKRNYRQLKRWLEDGRGTETKFGTTPSPPAPAVDQRLPPEPPAPWK